MTAPTAQSLARELWDTACYDEDASIPAAVLLAICARESIDIETCDTCGQYDGEHVDGCEHGACGICGHWYRACICDAVYERWADK